MFMAEIRAQYDELARKNREELDKYWTELIEESTTIVTTQSIEVETAEMTLTELRRTVQSLEIDLDSMRNTKISLENSLREVEARYALQIEQLNGILLHLESELAQTRAEGQHQAQEYEALLNIKVKLEAEIATYRRLLEDGEDFSLSDALNSSNSMQTIQKTTTRRIVDGKVVSETNDTKVLRH
ncbi:Keratin, type I cytoskeletal 18 [Saguinus oedipus]|uniref:Keratin, type I cytoskeletal 18 n=1 Tax=Saguinus oedipus TaxID=9490 RepID=A0ABQ9UNC7_SAGOE|nr:Keratin, type I cytoskeletal 18 [Saguinus oedipus]